MKENFLSELNIKEYNQSNNKSAKKRKLSKFEKDIIKVNYLSNLKMRKNYNCTKKSYEKIIVNYLLNNASCHIVSIFKEKMLLDYIDEFLRRQYSLKESTERIPKFAIYYKNYLLFFCMPTFTNFGINEIINDYGEKRAELYYKKNYQGGKSYDNEDLGFEESDSDNETEKDYNYKINENGEIFCNSIKENIDNVTIMTTISNSKNNTINLNLNHEKIEVFSENKCEKSNDTTVQELMDIVKKGQEDLIKMKNNQNNKIDKIESNTNNNISNYESHHNNNSNNYPNSDFNKSKKSHKNKKKNNILNLIDYKKAMLSRRIGQNHNKRKEAYKSLKKYLDKNNFDINIHLKGNKLNNIFSIDKLQKIFKKGGNVKNYNYFIKNNNFPINNFLNIISDKNNNNEKIILNSKKLQEKDIKDKENMKSRNIHKKFSNLSVNLNLKTKSKSKEKNKDKKNSKNKSNNNRFNSNKNSYANISNNIIQNNLYQNNFNIGCQDSNKNKSRSRNNTGFLYKQKNNTNYLLNNNFIYNLNNIYNTTSLHKLYRNLNNNIKNNEFFGKINPFKTLNFIQTTKHHQRYNNNFIQIISNDNKNYKSNKSQDSKSSSLKILVTDLNNKNQVKPSFKLQNERDLIKSKYSNKDKNIYNANNKNRRITKSFNNLNIKNIHLSNNGITSYNNIKYKNKKYKNNSKSNNHLKNIKGNQINSNSSNKNKKLETNNKDLMQLALSFLLDNNSTFNNMPNNNINNLHRNNINKKSYITKNSNIKNYIKKNKLSNINNNKNKYHNNNTNYNININNQININTNTNNLYNNLKNGKDYLNTKLKNKEINIYNNNNNLKDANSHNLLYNNSNLHVSGVNGVNNHNHNSENINLNKNINIRNIHSGLKKGKLYFNKNNINTKHEENIIKSYHTKSVSSLTDLINYNKKINFLLKNVSKSKSKDHKNNC